MRTKKLIDILEKDMGPFSFAIYLRGARARIDMSQVQMARHLGITKSTLCDIEKGRQLVSPALAAKIAKKCGVSTKLAVQTAINDQLRRAGLKFKVELKSS